MSVSSSLKWRQGETRRNWSERCLKTKLNLCLSTGYLNCFIAKCFVFQHVRWSEHALWSLTARWLMYFGTLLILSVALACLYHYTAHKFQQILLNTIVATKSSYQRIHFYRSLRSFHYKRSTTTVNTYPFWHGVVVPLNRFTKFYFFSKLCAVMVKRILRTLSEWVWELNIKPFYYQIYYHKNYCKQNLTVMKNEIGTFVVTWY